MFPSATLFDDLAASYDASFAACERTDLDATSWVDHVPNWLLGSGRVFDDLHDRLPWRQRRGVRMYDSVVDEPRLSSWWHAADRRPEPLPVLAEVRRVLSGRYGVEFDSIGFNLYRDHHDSVAWHGDRHRRHVLEPVVAIVSVGDARTLRLRPRRDPGDTVGPGARRRSFAWRLGHGDLLVMGGACQHDWEHSVPKSRTPCGPRVSITFRHGTRETS